MCSQLQRLWRLLSRLHVALRGLKLRLPDYMILYAYGNVQECEVDNLIIPDQWVSQGKILDLGFPTLGPQANQSRASERAPKKNEDCAFLPLN